MNTSSPLAAMRPQSHFGRDIFGKERSHLGRDPLMTGSNNLRDQLLAQRDYFNIKCVRGSSPTASLAADLSQNFRINDASASPQIATPRRALFTRNMLESMESREYLTTPPMPASSSPGDMMDMTPLPHKAPFLAQIEIESPSPVQSPEDEMMVDSPFVESKPFAAERKKLRRPSITRAKGHSTGAMTSRLHSLDNQLPPLQFGGASRFGTQSPTASMALSECFQDSPTQERRPQTANSPSASAVASKPKPQFGSLTGGVRNGSPINAHTRRPSNPFLRPSLKRYRRSLSMFENSGDVMPKKEVSPISPTDKTLLPVADVDEPHVPSLPHFFPEGNNDSIPRIAHSTMLDVLDGKFGGHFEQTMVIDCRFEYEYEGGHINGAVNFNDKDVLTSELFRHPLKGRSLLIFHCEYSAHRAPIMARHIRAEDRNVNIECYPRLTYPEVYILEGGYSSFFSEHRGRCYPQAYIEMDDTNHVQTCEREMDRLRHHRKGLNRAQTFAFGQHGRAVDDSPTAPSRVTTRAHASPMLGRDILQNFESPIAFGRGTIGNVRDYEPCDLSMGASPVSTADRGHARRMVSF